MKVLLINAHHRYPGWSEGTLNDAAHQVATEFFSSRGDEVLETVVDDGYEVAEEEAKHLAADLVVVQTPANWFGAPWTWKKYVDEVFNHVLTTTSMLSGDGRTRSDLSKPYGSGGRMQGRKMLLSSTWNAPADAFDNADNPVFVGRSLADALSEITATYRFCGYDVLPDFAILDVFKNPTIEADLEAYAKHLEQYAV